MSSFDAHDLDLDKFPEVVRDRLTQFLDAQELTIADIGAPVTDAVAHLRSFVLNGGKRIRPLYAWAGFLAAQGHKNSSEKLESVLDAAASLEFIQACALIHDDIIDSSDTRRGAPQFTGLWKLITAPIISKAIPSTLAFQSRFWLAIWHWCGQKTCCRIPV